MRAHAARRPPHARGCPPHAHAVAPPPPPPPRRTYLGWRRMLVRQACMRAHAAEAAARPPQLLGPLLTGPRRLHTCTPCRRPLQAALPAGRALLWRGVLVPPLPQRSQGRRGAGACTCAHTCTHMCTRAHTHTHTHADMHTHVHTHTHTHTQTHTHTHTTLQDLAKRHALDRKQVGAGREARAGGNPRPQRRARPVGLVADAAPLLGCVEYGGMRARPPPWEPFRFALQRRQRHQAERGPGAAGPRAHLPLSWLKSCVLCSQTTPSLFGAPRCARSQVQEVECALCGLRQPVAETCSNCRVRFGRYSCLKCNFFGAQGGHRARRREVAQMGSARVDRSKVHLRLASGFVVKGTGFSAWRLLVLTQGCSIEHRRATHRLETRPSPKRAPEPPLQPLLASRRAMPAPPPLPSHTPTPPLPPLCLMVARRTPTHPLPPPPGPRGCACQTTTR